MRLATLSMFALYLCVPRLKEYAYFEMAIYAAMLVADLLEHGEQFLEERAIRPMRRPCFCISAKMQC